MSRKLEQSVLGKLVAMFSPSASDFLDFDAADVICGPNDRAVIGFDTHFPKQWLVEDFGFTEEEAAWLIDSVRAASASSRPATSS